MTASASACSAVVLNQQQQTIQHHEHCSKAKPDSVAQNDATQRPVPPPTEHCGPKHCTVVEHGRVVVKDMPTVDDVDSTENPQIAAL